MSEIKFGTDGWRAVISEAFTFENVEKVAQAMASYIIKDGLTLNVRDKRIVIGYDTRFLSEKYAELIACVLAGNGIRIILSDRAIPTPTVSFTIKDHGLVGGIMVTASHNPPRYNGIKYKTYYGGSASSDITKKFEENLGKTPVKRADFEQAKASGLIEVKNVLPAHFEFLKKYVDMNLLRKSKMKILVDSMYGTGSYYIQDMFKGSSCTVDTIHGDYNPGFGGMPPEPKLPNLQELADKTKQGKYDIGIATDGDSDRVGIALPDGSVLTGHKVMALLLLHLLEDRKMSGGVVQTICGTVLIDAIARKYNLKTFETAVGFKYIGEIIIKEDIIVGGEETGGVAFKNYIPERDGILSGLLMLEMMIMRKKTLADIIKSVDAEYGTFEYRRLDVKYPDEKKQALMRCLKDNPPKEVLGRKVISVKDTDGYKFICEDKSWLMMRLSGTEPILRVYAEAPNEKKALEILAFGKNLADGVK